MLYRLHRKDTLKLHGAVTPDQITHVKSSNRRGEVKRTPARTDHRNSRGYAMYRGLYLCTCCFHFDTKILIAHIIANNSNSTLPLLFETQGNFGRRRHKYEELYKMGLMRLLPFDVTDTCLRSFCTVSFELLVF